MQELLHEIENKTTVNTKETQEIILNMICSESSPIPLSAETLKNALSIEGEFLALTMSYDDFNHELENGFIKYKISQALSVIISYEDDGSCFDDIENFIKYIYNNSDDKQNSTFGIKKVNQLSNSPITIFFSGILPINQLKMTVGKEIDKLIHSDDAYFIPRFQKHRDDISKEIGIPILPVLPILDTRLGDFQVRLLDIIENKVISEFEINEVLSKDTVETYLLKLFYIYKVLIEEKRDTSKSVL